MWIAECVNIESKLIDVNPNCGGRRSLTWIKKQCPGTLVSRFELNFTNLTQNNGDHIGLSISSYRDINTAYALPCSTKATHTELFSFFKERNRSTSVALTHQLTAKSIKAPFSALVGGEWLDIWTTPETFWGYVRVILHRRIRCCLAFILNNCFRGLWLVTHCTFFATSGTF